MLLTIDNSMCEIQGLTPLQLRALKQLMSYTIDAKAAYFASAYNTRRYLISDKGQFPTGLLYIVIRYLWKVKAEFKLDDKRVCPAPRQLFKMTLGHAPYPEQLEAAVAASVASRGIICAPTGVGKSLIVTLIVNKLQVPTLVVVPSLELKRQLTKSLKEAFGDTYTKHLKVENVDALDPNEEAKGYDCVIIDEFHKSGAKRYRKLNKKAWKNVYYKFGLTATPFRSQDNERLLLESVLSQVIYRIDHKTAVDKGYIVPIEAYFLELPKRPVEGYTWNQVYNELVINNAVRNQVICDLMKRLHADGASSLCLVKEIKHGDIIAGKTGAAFANGLNEETQQLIAGFNSKALTCLIGTTGILGEGVDTKPAEYVIIAGLGRSKNAFMQQVGRGFRVYPGKESCKVILFKDISHKWTLQHFKAQVKYMREEYGVEPVKLEVE